MRKTKIVVTAGRVYNDDKTLRKFLSLGADIIRTNMAHQSHEWHDDLLKRLYMLIKESCRDVKIEADISGPKVRTGENPKGMYFIPLKQGQEVVLTTGSPAEGKINIPYPALHSMVDKGNTIFIDDASVQLEVMEKKGSDIICRSLSDSNLGGKRTVAVPGKDFDLPTITERDWKDLEFLTKYDIDYLGLSFVKTKEDVERAREFTKSHGMQSGILSKIETQQGARNMDSIIKASDAIMIARGDMKAFCTVEKVPGIQRQILEKCRGAGKFVIVATEMLNSMKINSVPTCAEANDIYNAVLQGADAVMLSGETTEGKHPIRAMEYMVRIVEEAEKEYR